MTIAPAQAAGRVDVRREGDVAVLTLHRPAKLNALSTHLENELRVALTGAAVHTSSAVVITGGESVFSAGADLAELREMTTADITQYYRGSGVVYEEVAALPQPTIAAIAGYCVGGGFELALAADFRVADPSAMFALPEVGLGIVPSSGGTLRLTRAVGPARARDLILRGRSIGPDEALSWGLITELAAPAEHLARALALASELTVQPPQALTVAARLIDAATHNDRETTLLLEQLSYAALANECAQPRSELV